MIVDTDVQACAARGARLLDRVTPHWYERLSLGYLSMINCRWCILGQIYGEYTTGLSELFGNQPDGSRVPLDLDWYVASDHYGFSAFYVTDVTPELMTPSQRTVWAELGHAWRAEITRRRLAPLAPCYTREDVELSA